MVIISSADKKKFIKKQKEDPFCECIGNCPFNIVEEYMIRIPDAFGETAKEFNKTTTTTGMAMKDRPHLFRALSTGRERHFLTNTLGKTKCL